MTQVEILRAANREQEKGYESLEIAEALLADTRLDILVSGFTDIQNQLSMADRSTVEDGDRVKELTNGIIARAEELDYKIVEANTEGVLKFVEFYNQAKARQAETLSERKDAA